ncbi:biliverdin-producing heme oxygenase [Luteimonas terrae]|uniref:Heme oxygenase n=1 Tax=Luteimonas terrae TaxID=1530191 RepID=A0ABU1XT87_9GAMM|nr:biliverdin-producing heme oxygenase [Luteimonas terrae]MDR7191948.1 heme oxygenase [Luteimonas terrae]
MNTALRKLDVERHDLRHFLRAETSDLHARVDACFADGLGTPLTYGRYLVGMQRFAADFEVVIGAVPRASYWLSGDLHDLALAPLPPSGVRGYAIDADTRLGWEYVMAGSSLGARHLLRGVQSLGHDERSGARFLARHAGGDSWRNVLDRLAARSALTDLPYDDLLQGARDAFLLVQSCFERAFAAMPAPQQEPAA